MKLNNNFRLETILIQNKTRISIDKVSGYHLNQIQNALNHCRNIECWENKLNNNRPAGVSTEALHQLFDYVREVRNNASNW